MHRGRLVLSVLLDPCGPWALASSPRGVYCEGAYKARFGVKSQGLQPARGLCILVV